MPTVYAPDIFSHEAIQGPHAHYRAMAALGPLVWLEATGCWATTNYAAAEEVLARDADFTSGRGVSLNDAMNKMLVGSTLNSQGDEHSKRKRVSIRPLMPASIKPLEPQIRAASEALVTTLPSRVEAVRHISRHLPVNIVTNLVGVPKEHADDLLSWAAATFNMMGPDNDLAKAQQENLAALRAFVQDPETPKRLKPGSWAAALYLAEAAGKIPAGWAAEQMRDYLNPSLDTTIATTSYGLLKFAQDPTQWQKLRHDPSLIPNAVEEMARMCAPIRGFSRYVVEDTTVSGQQVQRGQRIFVLFAAANRDPKQFSEPDTFDVSRNTARHMGFGQGRHFCLGMHLARMEMRVLLETLAKRVKSFHLDGDPVVGLNNTIYGLEQLPLRMEFEQ